ncbi:MAG: cupredoxin domain-containing protein [Myxococcaceae bacterium]|nr:cupredoxin domain-containing protein [Myxococcaceae bacterium]MCI0672363.1 cupredoxin domain-containing protein [Myxococcaceae bacterium]
MHTWKKLLLVPAVALGTLAPAAALACDDHDKADRARDGHAAGIHATAGGSASAAQKGTPARKDAKARTVELAVTSKGFEPANVTVKKGEPLRLVITRKTDVTCAKEIVIDEPGIRRELPLNTPVEVTFTPSKSGEIRYGCGMDKMLSGVLRVE